MTTKTIRPKISSSIFVYIPKARLFVSDASTLEVNSQYSCNVGFTMVGEKTGLEIDFVLNDIKRSNENEILSWVFQASPYYNDSITEFLTAEIHND